MPGSFLFTRCRQQRIGQPRVLLQAQGLAPHGGGQAAAGDDGGVKRLMALVPFIE